MTRLHFCNPQRRTASAGVADNNTYCLCMYDGVYRCRGTVAHVNVSPNMWVKLRVFALTNKQAYIYTNLQVHHFGGYQKTKKQKNKSAMKS